MSSKEDMVKVARALALSLATSKTDKTQQAAHGTLREIMGEAARLKRRMDADKERLEHLREAASIVVAALGEEKYEAAGLLAYLSPAAERRAVHVAEFVALMGEITVSKKAREQLMQLVHISETPRQLLFRKK